MRDTPIVNDGAERLDEADSGDGGRQVMVADQRSAAVQRANEAPRSMSPGELIQYAIANKLPAAELKELVALHEHMEARIAARAFHEAMAAFQRECPPIKKNKTANITTKSGSKFSYSYAERDEMEEHIRPYREKHGLSHSFDTIVDERGVMLTNICTVSHVLGHSRASRFTLPIANDSAASPQQKVGAADSYAARRSLSAAYGLSITDKEVPDSEVDPTTITDDQAVELEDMLRESAADRAKFLEYFDAATVAGIRAANYKPAVSMLREKIAKKGSAKQSVESR